MKGVRNATMVVVARAYVLLDDSLTRQTFYTLPDTRQPIRCTTADPRPSKIGTLPIFAKHTATLLRVCYRPLWATW
jgi:hypothetical protein